MQVFWDLEGWVGSPPSLAFQVKGYKPSRFQHSTEMVAHMCSRPSRSCKIPSKAYYTFGPSQYITRPERLPILHLEDQPQIEASYLYPHFQVLKDSIAYSGRVVRDKSPLYESLTFQVKGWGALPGSNIELG